MKEPWLIIEKPITPQVYAKLYEQWEREGVVSQNGSNRWDAMDYVDETTKWAVRIIAFVATLVFLFIWGVMKMPSGGGSTKFPDGSGLDYHEKRWLWHRR